MKETEIKAMFRTLGADVCGIAGEERFAAYPEGFSPRDTYPECRSVISFGVTLTKGLEMVRSRLVYAHFNYDVIHRVDAIALAGANRIEREFDGIAVPMPSDSPYEYWDAEKNRAAASSP